MADACSARRPNVLVFIADQLRYDHLGCYGNPIVRTPNIDALAESGVVCERAYVANPLCMPARASLFTGRTPRGHGVRTNGIPLSPEIPTFPEALRQSGYRTHAVGKLHMHTYGHRPDADPARFPESIQGWNSGARSSLESPYYGFESVELTIGHGHAISGHYRQWIEQNHHGALERMSPAGARWRSEAPQTWAMDIPDDLHHTAWVADRACHFLRENAMGSDEQPFFLWCSFPDPHTPYTVPEPWASMYAPSAMSQPNRVEGELASLPPFYGEIYERGRWVGGLTEPASMWTPWIAHIMAMTYGMVSFVDEGVGRVMRTLEACGLRENTLVVFLSDHGDMMGDHWMNKKGPFHFEGLLRVPLIWNLPGRIAQGVRSSGVVSQIDFAPTLLEYCGVPIPQGEIMLDRPDSLQLPPWPGRSLSPQLDGAQAAVNDCIIVENDEDWLGLRLRTLVTERYKLTTYPGNAFGELFDLSEDPLEQNNLWDDKGSSRLRDSLHLQLYAAYVQQESTLPRRIAHA